jgi:hypothetical protein
MTKRSDLQPPWHRFPAMPAGDIGWRMGDGETYLCDLTARLAGMSANDRRRWLQAIEIPDEWLFWATDWYAYPDDSEDALDAAWEALSDPI